MSDKLAEFDAMLVASIMEVEAAASELIALTSCALDALERTPGRHAEVEAALYKILSASGFGDIIGQRLGRIRGMIGALPQDLRDDRSLMSGPDGGEPQSAADALFG